MVDTIAGIVAEMRGWRYEHGNPDSYVVAGWADRLEALAAAPTPSEAVLREHDGSTPENPRPDGSYGWPQADPAPSVAWHGGDPQPALTVPNSFTLAVPPPTLQINQSNGAALVKIMPDGSIEYGPDYTPDAAARMFWESIAWLSPTAAYARIVAEKDATHKAMALAMVEHERKRDAAEARAEALAGVLRDTNAALERHFNNTCDGTEVRVCLAARAVLDSQTVPSPQ